MLRKSIPDATPCICYTALTNCFFSLGPTQIHKDLLRLNSSFSTALGSLLPDSLFQTSAKKDHVTTLAQAKAFGSTISDFQPTGLACMI